MIEIVDGLNMDTIGIRYDTEESAAAVFALGLYAGQLAAGNIVDVDDDKLPVHEVIDLTRVLQAEVASGLTVVSSSEHQAIVEIYLPYLTRMHEGLPIRMYEGVCDTLLVKPFELFYNAIVSRRMLKGNDIGVELI